MAKDQWYVAAWFDGRPWLVLHGPVDNEQALRWYKQWIKDAKRRQAAEVLCGLDLIACFSDGTWALMETWDR